MWISDSEGTLVRLNRACCELFHLKPEELVGKYNVLRDNIVQEQGFMPLVRRVFEEGESVKFILNYDSSRLRGLTLSEAVSVLLEVTISAGFEQPHRQERKHAAAHGGRGPPG